MPKPAKKKAASASGLKGAVGEHFVEGVFLQLGWGPVPVSKHDTGTDFFVQVRDQELVELGLLLGVQVKNEKEYFTPRAAAKADERGYWEYKAAQDETEYWLDHAIPHVLALYDRNAKTAYWGRVMRDTVRWTEAAARIQIPVGNKLDFGSRDELLSIAGDSRRSIAWSPATWLGVDSLPPARRLRTALLAPRVAAPRGASGRASSLPEAAIARLMLGQFPGHPGRSNENMPTQAEQMAGAFSWKLHNAFWAYLQSGHPGSLDELTASATQPHERIALTAIRASSALERGNARGALRILDETDDADLVDPVDGAWLDAHRSRCLRELNELESAQDLALKVAAIGLLHAHDHGAVALRAAVLNNTFYAFESPAEDVQLAVSAADSPPVWWRDQHRAWALTEVLDLGYKKWAGRGSTAHHTDTDAWDRLRGVTLSAGMNADHRAWRIAMSELARYVLSTMDLADTPLVVTCLDNLRNCGDHESVNQAVNHLLMEGPIEPVSRIAQQIGVADCTQTNLVSTLEVLKLAVDLLDAPELECYTTWALEQLSHPNKLPRTHKPFAWIATDYLLPTLRTAYRLLEPKHRGPLRQHLITMSPVPNQILAEAFASMARDIPPEEWTEDELRSLQLRAASMSANDAIEITPFGDHRSLGHALSAVLAQAGDADRLAGLYEQLAAGNWQPLEDLGAIEAVPATVLSKLIPHLIRDIDERNNQAEAGHWEHPVIYSGEILLIINCTHPALADWDPIYRVLEGHFKAKWDQASLASRLADMGDLLDEQIIERVEPALISLAKDHDDARFFNPRADDAARIALLKLTTRLDDVESFHSALVAGIEGRKAVAHAIGRQRVLSSLGLLTALATDTHFSVRAAATGAAVTWQQHDPQPAVQTIVDALLDEGGYANAFAAIRAIRNERHSDAVEAILKKLSKHPSARVRWRATQLLNGESPPA